MLGKERAIVTEIPGTTRDQLYEKFIIEDIPISLIDTAGLRETSDLVESIGVERSKTVMFDSDIVIVLLDGSEKITAEDKEIISQVKVLNHFIAINKTDLKQINNDFLHTSKTIAISAKTGEGLDELKKFIVKPFILQEFENSGFLVSDARHNDLLLRAKFEIESSSYLLDEKKSEEFILVGLHNALNFLGKITGETSTEDMLSQIFSTFCIGK